MSKKARELCENPKKIVKTLEKIRHQGTADEQILGKFTLKNGVVVEYKRKRKDTDDYVDDHGFEGIYIDYYKAVVHRPDKKPVKILIEKTIEEDRIALRTYGARQTRFVKNYEIEMERGHDDWDWSSDLDGEPRQVYNKDYGCWMDLENDKAPKWAGRAVMALVEGAQMAEAA